ncbi:MAG: hypothetical protein AB8E87_08670 [Prochlorococcus sp.]
MLAKLILRFSLLIFIELNDFNFVKIDPGTEERIKHQNILDILQRGSGIIGASEDSLLGKLGFDAGINGSSAKIRNLTSGFGFSGASDLLGLAARIGGKATSGVKGLGGEARWVPNGEKQESVVGGTNISRTREQNVSDKEGNHTRTTVVVTTSKQRV